MRAAGGGAEHARLIGDRAGEAAAPVAEQLAVGQLAGRAGAVVGQEHRVAARRPGVDGARDQVLAGAALAGDEHRQVAALQALDLIGDALHRGAGADEPGNQRLERSLDRARRPARPDARAPSRARIPAASTAQSVRNRCSTVERERAHGRHRGEAGTVARRGRSRRRRASPAPAPRRARGGRRPGRARSPRRSRPAATTTDLAGARLR